MSKYSIASLSSHIILIGFMGTGKSTVSRVVAKHMGLRYMDCDSVIEKEESKILLSVEEIGV